MKENPINTEKRKQRCNHLETYGFLTTGKDYDVKHPALSYSSGNHVFFDFSAIRMEPDSVMYEALQTAYKQGKKDGQLEIKNAFQKLMNIDVD